MKGLKKKRRIQIIIVAAAALTLSSALVGYAFRGGINYFRSPTQVAEQAPPANEIFRIGGLVEKGTLVRGEGKTITFEVTDGNKAVPVHYTGVLPDLFAEGAGMIATGHMKNGVFEAREILAKHDSTYMPKEVIDALKKQGTYVAPKGSS
ncbi:cytochrome C biogenesis protein CcdA [Defluviimonas sp. 20V17]|uniref:Cytochrome c-type biogenesis protein CcmE n=1 Tax=Allgaiera indica TaxID=765699 RepID=A0AAN4UVM3_9RHOB|nr:cytochrome c maturation protein CcmE [Allgaiera indica]KDB04928.1 cytochrome C biogenesis protein CcdA [Defluviimonas sp. 20V17]GHE05682.1 cytochrome c-type biogenesis protein CcmE [Allgaiera indica]SDX76202.1 cytochrome c-type biogenesis protein CcmE [Allgaiera indica]